MSGTQTKNLERITLKGSAAIITDFMNYGINMILFQREVYDAADFEKVDRYGRPVFITTNEKLKKYLDGVLNGLRTLLENDECRRVDLVIINVEDDQTIERWEFEIEPTNEGASGQGGDGSNGSGTGNGTGNGNDENLDPLSKTRTATKDLNKIQQQIMKIMRQIIATVSMLPNYDQDITFNILLHTKKRGKSEMKNWWETDSRVTSIAGEGDSGEGQEGIEILKFDSLRTGVQNVHSKVCYRVGL